MKGLYNFRWQLSAAFVVSFLFTLPFIVNNNYFIDDWLRSDTGNSGWEGNGRPLASAIMSALSLFPHGRHVFGDNALFDIFPLTLIISSALLVLTGYIFCQAMMVNDRFLSFIICCIPVCNPYWVGNIEFRHDSLLMSASFLLAVIAGCISLKSVKYASLSAIMVASSLSLYQTSLNAYISMASCLLLHSYLTGNKVSWRSYALTVSPLVVGYLIYSTLIMKMAGFSDYAASNSKLISLNLDMPLSIYENFKSYFSFVYHNSPPTYLTIILVCSAIACVSVYNNYGITFKLLASIIILVFCFLMSLGVLSLFERPAIAARTMMPITIFFMLCASLTLGKLSRVASASFSCAIVVSFCFCYIISSAINNTERNDRFIAMHIASLYAKDSMENVKDIYITGKPDFTRYTKRVMNRLPMAKYMVISAFNNYRFKYSLMAQYGIESQAPKLDKAKRYDYISRKGKPHYQDSVVESFIDGNTVIYKIK